MLPRQRRRVGAGLRLPLLLLLLLLATACRGGGPTFRLSGGQLASFRGEAHVAGVTTTVVEVGDDYFKPTVLTGAPGQRLTVTLSNQGNELHNFRIPAQHIDENLTAGTPVTVTVTFPTSGSVVFECRFHLSEHMRGELRAASAGPAP